MPSAFVNVHIHAGDKRADRIPTTTRGRVAIRGVGKAPVGSRERTFNDDEAAARFYLREMFQEDSRPTVRGIADTSKAQLVPDFRLLSIQNSPLTKTRIIRFEQTVESIPIFGSLAVVELDRNRKPVSRDAEVAQLRGQSAMAKISPDQALQRIAKKARMSVAKIKGVKAPVLTFYHDDKKNSWHLAYLFRHVPAAPPEFLESTSRRKSPGHGLALSPREKHPALNYVVDARNGDILLFYSATPRLAAALVIPSKCYGIDDDENNQEFWGQQSGRGFEMNDPLRAIKTYDLLFGEMDKARIPARAVYNGANKWQKKNRAAVSAHLNATRVYDFYNSVLQRKGVDNKGMELISVVNCTYRDSGQAPPEWHNACWWQDRMWYGQEKKGKQLRSFSRYLDIIAHELTHGVTQYSSNLEYMHQSGALSESFSDILAIIIKNWYGKGANSSVDKWDWEIGSGMRGNGLPLRDLRNPRRTGDPDHMKRYLRTSDDEGGVHTNSNIHNKAAYNVLTAKDSKGKYVFSPKDVAVLYYLCLVHLSSLATFSKTLKVLLDVTKTYYRGDRSVNAKLNAIKKAYGKVGIK